MEKAVALLGWVVECKSPPKSSYVSLCVQFEVAKVMLGGELVVKNTLARIAALKDEVRGILAAGKLTPAQAGTLRGRLGFAAAQ
eukprot:11998489-Heterocapsa_arctica.AAC.1